MYVTNMCRKCASVSLLTAALVGCGASSSPPDKGVDAHAEGGSRADAARDGTLPHDAHADAEDSRVAGDGGPDDAPASVPDVAILDAAACTGGCPTGYRCSSANGLPVCRAPSGIPLFTHVFVILEENTSLATLVASIDTNAAPNFASLRKTYASGTQYHGVAHPSLPNYVALTSGSTQGITCDCAAAPGMAACTPATCNLIQTNSCTCAQSVTNLADQIETAKKTWMAFGDGMGTPCNLAFGAGIYDGGQNYAARHVPFVYYDDIQNDTTRCNAHVVDYSLFDPATASSFTYIAPNLVDDMHNPIPATQGNITDGDNWIGPVVASITSSSTYLDGGLLIIVWDEDDNSGIGTTDSGMLVTDTDNPIPIFVLSPYAKSGGFMSVANMDHYTLLATIEDGLALPRLGSAGVPRATFADTLADYFPDK